VNVGHVPKCHIDSLGKHGPAFTLKTGTGEIIALQSQSSLPTVFSEGLPVRKMHLQVDKYYPSPLTVNLQLLHGSLLGYLLSRLKSFQTSEKLIWVFTAGF